MQVLLHGPRFQLLELVEAGVRDRTDALVTLARQLSHDLAISDYMEARFRRQVVAEGNRLLLLIEGLVALLQIAGFVKKDSKSDVLSRGTLHEKVWVGCLGHIVENDGPLAEIIGVVVEQNVDHVLDIEEVVPIFVLIEINAMTLCQKACCVKIVLE